MSLLDVFIPNAGEQLRRLRESLGQAPAEEALDELARDAHTLRGGAATVGLPRLAAMAESIEVALGCGEYKSARTAVDAASVELEVVRAGVHTVLHVDDDPTSLELVEQIAEHAPGVRLLSAGRGETGLELAARERPDLILLDLMLPDLPGEEMLRVLRSNPATAAASVVVLSARAEPTYAERLLAAGATDYLTKPLDVDQVLELLGRPS